MSEMSENVSTKNLTLTLQGKEGAIGIRKNVVKALGCPRFVSLRVSCRKNSLLLIPCESADVMSFEMPHDFIKSHHVNFRIHSLQFVQELLRNNELRDDATYVITGKYLHKNNAIVFPIDTALPMNSQYQNG